MTHPLETTISLAIAIPLTESKKGWILQQVEQHTCFYVESLSITQVLQEVLSVVTAPCVGSTEPLSVTLTFLQAALPSLEGTVRLQPI